MCIRDSGWDDPRLVTITALRRRGYTASSIRKFMELCGVSKSNSSVDSAMLEYCIREDLKMSQPRMMAVLDPVKLVIDNYEEGKIEYLDVDVYKRQVLNGIMILLFMVLFIKGAI